jgi:hypothetical protein
MRSRGPRKNRKQAIADEFQDFTSVPFDRDRQGLKVFVEEGDHVVARPELGDRREPSEVTDHHCGPNDVRSSTPLGQAPAQQRPRS